ncbi:thiol:disulfide interchange protein DsbA/DsbL [Chitinimonas sp.]|uniref:thiol:disulfide interchange protein DsbA/DsbL n=1 Tax=Chitinimonas sp. TaxID=1934313 RepID=UPI0035B0F709
MLHAITRRSVLFGLAALAAFGVNAAEPVAGTDYQVLKTPQPIATPGKGEVIEFFWYGCPHCFHYEPFVEAWAKTLPKDVVFRREHALFAGRSDMEGHGRLFVALKSLGKVEALTPKVFDAIHKDKIELRDQDKLFDWISKQGVDRKQFEGAYGAFSMQAELKRQEQNVATYQLTGVPAFVVNGKYVVSAKGGDENGQQLFATINALLTKDKPAGKDAKPASKDAKAAAKK